jgi:hypothetical protein
MDIPPIFILISILYDETFKCGGDTKCCVGPYLCKLFNFLNDIRKVVGELMLSGTSCIKIYRTDWSSGNAVVVFKFLSRPDYQLDTLTEIIF